MTMRNPIRIGSRANRGRSFAIALLAAAFLWVALPGGVAAKEIKPKGFATPEAAVQAFVDAVRGNNVVELVKILGPDGIDIVSSGDKVEDNAIRDRFLKDYDQKHAVVVKGPEEAELVTGSDNWPFPIPIVKAGKAWILDAAAGLEEIQNRRIGRNELSTLDVLEAFVQAEREYYQLDWDDDAVPEYAQKIMSSEGQKDGLYWVAAEDEEASPLGPFVAKAASEGYTRQEGGAKPYHGYTFKILTAQGPDAPGGAYSYVLNGNMVAGFAMVAWPAEWDNSGLMTFVVNGNGVIYEKDLGEKTGEIASAMTTYNPDSTWRRAR
jgi:hypothetical protein